MLFLFCCVLDFGFQVFGLCCCPALTFGVTPSPRFMTLASRVTSLGFLHEPRRFQEAGKPRPQRSLSSISNSHCLKLTNL